MGSSRKYGIDLFRIISMFMVVILHVLGQGGILDATDHILVNSELVWVFEAACFLAVDCFALISGYVGLTSKHRIKNIISLWLQVFFSSAILSVIRFCLDPSVFTLKSAISIFLPVLTRRYWYFTDYVILFLFTPLLNAAVNSIEKVHLRWTIIGISILFTLSSFFPGYQLKMDPFQIHQGYSAMWLMLLYLIGAYIRKYPPYSNIKNNRFLLIYLVCTLLAAASKIIANHIPILYTFISKGVLIAYDSPLILIGSIALLVYFSRLNITKKSAIKVISHISPLCFGIYIIHLHPLIWSYLHNRFAFIASHSPFALIGVIIGAALCIFSACALVEWMRFYLFKLLKITELASGLERKLKDIFQVSRKTTSIDQ